MKGHFRRMLLVFELDMLGEVSLELGNMGAIGANKLRQHSTFKFLVTRQRRLVSIHSATGFADKLTYDTCNTDKDHILKDFFNVQ